MNILTETLKKIGKNYEELSPQAKAQYDRWETILNTDKIDVNDLATFLTGERELLVKELIEREMTISSSSLFNLRLIDANSLVDRSIKDRISIFDLIVNIVKSPKKNAKILEDQLRRNLPNLKKVR